MPANLGPARLEIDGGSVAARDDLVV